MIGLSHELRLCSSLLAGDQVLIAVEVPVEAITLQGWRDLHANRRQHLPGSGAGLGFVSQPQSF
jgi:hypothetical protein